MERIYHRWENWECYPAGFFEEHPPKGWTVEDCEKKYAELLSNIDEFKEAMNGVIYNWKNSCEHNLTNSNMNRIAWMGQAALCYKYGIPVKFRGGFHLLTEEEQRKADEAALEKINEWLAKEGYSERYTIESIKQRTQQNLY